MNSTSGWIGWVHSGFLKLDEITRVRWKWNSALQVFQWLQSQRDWYLKEWAFCNIWTNNIKHHQTPFGTKICLCWTSLSLTPFFTHDHLNMSQMLVDSIASIHAFGFYLWCAWSWSLISLIAPTSPMSFHLPKGAAPRQWRGNKLNLIAWFT